MSKPKHSAVPASAPVAGEATRRGKFLPEHVTQQMIWNVQAVIEGECGGLSLDERQARNVMSFLMSEHGPDAAPQASEAVRDAAFEAVRKQLCKLPRYSFFAGAALGSVRRVEDRSGNWIEFDAAHALFDPVAVDAALSAQPGVQKD